MTTNRIRLKKGEERRILAGHPWVFSNEVDTKVSPLKALSPGQEVGVEAYNKIFLGSAYVNPHSLISARIFSRKHASLDASFFNEHLEKALAARTAFFDKPFYRLVFSEADNLPGLVVDRFDDTLVVQLNTAGMEQRKELVIEALKNLLPEIKNIFLKNDSSIRQMEGLENYHEVVLGTVPETILLEENGLKFYAPLLTGQKTGWFYDHRLNRARLKDHVANKSVLDVFSYLGGFGIQAAAFGAASVDCIDASKPACELIEKNAELNQVDKKINIICGDAFDAMKALLQQKKQYDVIVLDPPAFVKRAKDKKEGLVAYQRINQMALELLKPGGVLFSCSCSMQVSMEELTQVIQKAASRSRSFVQIIERGHQGPDHPIHPAVSEMDYLKAIIVRKI